jgi:multidrug resistance efflux pump
LSLSDLTVGEDITVTLDANGNVTSIVTGIDMMRGQGQPGNAPAAAPSDSSAAASSASSAE